MKLYRPGLPSLLLLGSLFLAGCSESGGPQGPDPVVITVSLSPRPTTLKLGKTIQLAASVTSAEGNPVAGQPITWSARGAATVDGNGLVTSRSLGEATIVASTPTTADSISVSIVTAVTETSPLAVGVTHACGIAADAKAYCWGHNSYGILGIGTDDLAPHPTPQAVVTGLSFASLSSQGGFTCGLTTEGRAYCWGVDRDGSLGTVATETCVGEIGTRGCSTIPVAVATSQTFQSISAMWSHACGTTSDSRTFCWGQNARGQLGNGTTISSSNPTLSPALRFTSVVGSAEHTCGIATDQRVYCWGDNTAGQLGIGTIDATIRTFATAVNTSLTFRSLTAHGQNGGHTCGIASDDKTYCWGNNEYGQLGTGATAKVASPTPVATDLKFAAVAAGMNWTCGLTEVGEAYCWGGSIGEAIANTSRTCTGQAGELPCATVPVKVAPGIAFASLRLGAGSACGVTVDGLAYCWGANDTGKLGDGTTVNSATPVRVSGGRVFPAG